jgi:hypothetical protein
MDPTGWANGKYDSKNAEILADQVSEPEALHTMKQMCNLSG